MRLSPIWCSLSLCLFVVSAAHPISAQTKKVGFVLEMHGDWLANGQKIQQLGESVPAGATVALEPATSFHSGEEWKITIVLLNDQPIPVTCNSFDSCKSKQPFKIPQSLNEGSSLRDRFNQAVKHLLSLDPERYVSTISRGAGEPPRRLEDGVLLIEKGQLFIEEWFRGIAAGEYSLTFVYIGREGGSRDPVVLPLEWQSGKPASIDEKGLRAGLYVVRVFRADSSENQPISTDAWILVSTSSEYEKNATTYRQKTELTRSWTSVDAGAKETFLRVSLDQLATPVAPTDAEN